MRFSAVFVVLALLFGVWVRAEAANHATLRSKSTRPLACPASSAAASAEVVRRVPYQEFKLNKKEKLLICVPETALQDGQLKKKIMTNYDGYLFSPGQKHPKRALTGSYRVPVLFEQKKGVVYEVTHLNLRGNYLPIFREKILCRKGICQTKEKTCVFNQYQLSPPSPKDIEREKIIYAKATAHVQEMTEGDLAQMASLAFAGRKIAYDFFMMKEGPILMGVTKPFYEHMQYLLTQIKAEGHLKVAAK